MTKIYITVDSLIENAMYFFLNPKTNVQTLGESFNPPESFLNIKLLYFYIFGDHFGLPEAGPTAPIESESNPDPKHLGKLPAFSKIQYIPGNTPSKFFSRCVKIYTYVMKKPSLQF